MEAKLGRYLVLKHLASGGMADVLLGRTEGIEGFERHVVLKRIRPEHAKDERFIRMFLDEARVAANLHHQHIVQVHDIGESEGEYFIAMEYLHGEDVRTILSTASKKRQHVPLGCAMAIVSAAAAGLHYAHERRGPDKRPLGIVHRDISPSNILVGYDGSIKVVDFGIAKASVRQETRSSSLKGKISYMSPEQCKAIDVDRRSDVYSLGVVLYELATTTRLFKGETDYLVMDQIVNGRVTPPQARRPELPSELSAIIMRAIAPDPERRYFTADEFRLTLDQFAARAGLTTSTSAIATYMRKQFGEKPEPWLELEGRDFDSFEDVQLPATESMPGKSWTEMHNIEDFRRSTSSIRRPTGMIPVVTPGTGSETASRPVPRPPALLPPTTESKTESKMGWESQLPARKPLTFTPSKVAMICAPLIALLAIAVWRLSGSDDTSSTETAAAMAPPAAQPPASPPPVVTPIPEPPQVPATVPAGSVDQAAPPDAAPVPDPPPASKRPSSKRPSAARLAESGVAPSAPVTKSEPSDHGQKIAKTESTTTSSPPPVAPAPSGSAAAPGALQPLQGSAAPSPPAVPPPAVPPQVAAPSPPAASRPAPPSLPQTVASNALDANRIAGDKKIIPDVSTQVTITREHMDKVVGAFKVCVTAEGNIGTVSPMKSTGFPAYDAKIQDTIRRSWRYKPFLVNGKAVPVCTAVNFMYSQK